MTIYLATNKAVDIGGNVYDDTTSGRFDSDYVDSAISQSVSVNAVYPMFLSHSIDVSADTEAWLHYDLKMPASVSTSADGSYLRMFNSSGNLAMVISVLNGTYTLNVYNRSNTSTPSPGFFMPEGLNTFDFLYKDDGTNVTASIYSGGVLLDTITSVVGSGSSRMPNRIQFDHNDFIAGVGEIISYSQIIWANESTVGMKMEILEPAAAGNYTDLSATVTEVADADMATGWVGVTNAEKQSYTVGAYTVPAARAVHSVISMFDVRVGPTGPQNVRPFVRISGVDYPAPADIAPNSTTKRDLLGHAWTVNPATAAAWDAAAISALDVGIEIKT